MSLDVFIYFIMFFVPESVYVSLCVCDVLPGWKTKVEDEAEREERENKMGKKRDEGQERRKEGREKVEGEVWRAEKGEKCQE